MRVPLSGLLGRHARRRPVRGLGNLRSRTSRINIPGLGCVVHQPGCVAVAELLEHGEHLAIEFNLAGYGLHATPPWSPRKPSESAAATAT